MTYPRLHPRIERGRQAGIDWDRLRADNLAQLEKQAAEGVVDHETLAYVARKNGQEPPEKPQPKPVVDRTGIGGARPAYDRQGIVSMYVKELMTVDDIALKTGAHRQTVRNNLAAAGVVLRDDRKGNPRGRMGRKTVDQ